jgi:NAD(P)-dependent dehydrogenase (short-subunit alcohol dehydrogenase family)
MRPSGVRQGKGGGLSISKNIKLEGRRVAIVTGGSDGIGKACSLALAESGVDVAVLDKKHEEGLKTVHEFSNLPVKVTFLQTDISQREQVRKSVARVYTEFRRIDILVNCAGIVSPLKYFFEQTDEDWDKVIKVHLYGTYYMMKEVTPVMMRQNYGRIVNISSIDAMSGSCGRANYVAAKCGIEGLSLTAAKELGEYGITVNVIRPGFVVTPLTVARGYDFEAIARTVPRQRVGATKDIARMIRFLVEEESDLITGQIISVDGGLSICGAGISGELSPLKK